jgi:hypothetical protein
MGTGWYLGGPEGDIMGMMEMKGSSSALGLVPTAWIQYPGYSAELMTGFEGLVKMTLKAADKVDMVVDMTVDSIHRS